MSPRRLPSPPTHPAAADDATDDDAAVRAMDCLRRVVYALRASAQAVERATGITGAQLLVLREIVAAPGLSVRDVAARTRTRQSTVSEVVTRLVDAGLVTRARAADDARRATLRPTPAAAALVRDAPPSAQTRLIAALERMSRAQREALADAFDLWIVLAGMDGGEPAMFFEPGPPRAPARRPR